jgi:predicted nucleic acid-binding Zn ribbon protein
MTTYVYETIPSKAGEKPRYHEIKQSMKDSPLTKHPETGEPIRRVVLGGFGVLSSGKSGGQSTPARGSGCGPSCGCH